MPRILITGGNGLVGRELIPQLLEKGYSVHNLSRSGKAPEGALGFKWDYSKGEIDVKCIKGVDTIVHLAGASVAEKRWNPKRKQEILDSRVDTANLLYETLKNNDHQVKNIVSASGVAFYGVSNFDKIYTEEDPVGKGFLAEVSDKWEKAVQRFSDLGVRAASLRISVVLTPKGGALEQIAAPVRMGIGSPLASGRQIIPWIHYKDLVAQILFHVENSSSGIYNAASSDVITNKEFTKTLGRVLNRPVIFPNVPAFVLRIVIGEMADEIAINGSAVSNKKVQKEGFQYQFNDLEEALKDLYA